MSTISRPENDCGIVKKGQGNKRGAGRLTALDAARGLAVIGMFLQHFSLKDWNASIVSGNTTLLFVLCGGISYSIMAQRMKERNTEPASFRAKMLARAIFVDLTGYLLIMLNTPYGVILPAYAALFVLALLLVGRSSRTLLSVTVALWLLAPPLMILGGSLLSNAYLLKDIAGGPMSALALAPAFTAGMLIGRLDLTRIRTALSLTCSGAVMLVTGRLLGAYVLPGFYRSFEAWLVSVQGIVETQPDPYATWPLNVNPPLWHMLLGTAPHSASTFQTLIGLGAAILLLGIVFLVPKTITPVLLPFAAVGRTALTMYALQFLVVWILSLSGIEYSLGEVPLGDLIVAIITLAAGWILARLPNGPLETLMRRFDGLFSPALPKK